MRMCPAMVDGVSKGADISPCTAGRAMDGLLYVPRIRVSDLHKEMKEDFRFNGYEEHDIPKERPSEKCGARITHCRTCGCATGGIPLPGDSSHEARLSPSD